MNRKALLTYGLIFLLQFIFSCDICDCDIKTYKVDYYDIEVAAWNTAGFQIKEVEDTVYRNAFGLSVLVLFNQKVVQNTVSYGFSAAMACDCDPDKYIFKDPIDSISIIATNVRSGEDHDVTEKFAAYNYTGDGYISLQQLFEERAEWHDGFQFDLVNYDSIPESVVFTVHIFLNSGKKFSQQTRQINFYK